MEKRKNTKTKKNRKSLENQQFTIQSVTSEGLEPSTH